MNDRVFPKNVQALLPLRLDSADRKVGHRAVSWLAIMQILVVLIDRLDRFDDFGAAANAVLLFPVLTVSALCLITLGNLLRRHEDALVVIASEAGTPLGLSIQVIRWLKTGSILIGGLGILLGAAGFMEAAMAMVFPAALTLALLGALWVLRNFVGDLFVGFTGASEDARDGLIPVLIGLGLAAASLPLLAVIWGARWVELSELWSRLAEGVALGDTRISVGDFITFVLVFVIGFVVTRGLQSTLRTGVN